MRFLSMSLPIILALILATCALSQFELYPMPPDGISGEKYDGFSGVLTIFVEDNLTAQFPHLKRWLTEITNLFEKRNKGIYLSFARTGQSADILLCTPHDLPQGGCADVGEYDLMPAFQSIQTAVPVAAGGYLLGLNGSAPESLADLPDESIGYADIFSAVWVGLCEQFSTESTQKRTISTPDIGLIPTETPEPTAAAVVGTQITRQNLLFGDPDALFDAFLAGEILALPLNQNQVAKIRGWQADGRYADIQFRNAAAFTDLIAYAVIPGSVRDDATARAGAAREFIAMLLSDEAQAKLSRYDMFPTAMAAPVYEGVSGMQTIENALRRSDCVAQGPADKPIRVDFDAFLDGQISARELMRSLRNR